MINREITNKDPVNIFIIGLPCSGKTTVAHKLMNIFSGNRDHIKTTDYFHFDGDVLRKNITKHLGFSKEDREQQIKSLIDIIQIMNSKGISTLNSFIIPYNSTRKYIREQLKSVFFNFVLM